MNKTTITSGLLMLILGLGIGIWWPRENSSSSVAPTTEEKKPLYYRSPMNPTVTSPVPAKDSMGMDYVPVYADSSADTQTLGTVVIDPTVEQSIGVRTAQSVRKTISHDIRTIGRIAVDEKKLTRLHPKISGWVEKLFVDETGVEVSPDTMLLSIYSPQLVASQEEYLLALKSAATLKTSPFPDIRRGAENLLRTSRQRLQLLDVPEHQLRELDEKRETMKALHIHSPAAGIVLSIGAREGQHVDPKTELYSIADLSTVWAFVDIYEYELPWVQLHDSAVISLAALPGRSFTGNITYIYPYLDPTTRTNKVRVEFDNAEGFLKPDMFAEVTIHASRKSEAIVIPTQALIETGAKPKVFVRTGPGKFEPRDVRVGLKSDGETEILSGLDVGENVVTSAQFLIDSESSLSEAAAKMIAPVQAKDPEMPAGMNMEGDAGQTSEQQP